MSGGQKFDQGKLQYDLIPFECLDELAKILTYGAEKYGKPSGWQHVEDMENRYFAAAMRHLSAYRQGEKCDAESGHRHLSHALCNVVFLLWKELQAKTDEARETRERVTKSCERLIQQVKNAKEVAETSKLFFGPGPNLESHPHRRHTDRAIYGDVNIPPQEGLDYRPGVCITCGFEIGHAGWCEGVGE